MWSYLEKSPEHWNLNLLSKVKGGAPREPCANRTPDPALLSSAKHDVTVRNQEARYPLWVVSPKPMTGLGPRTSTVTLLM